MSKQGLRDGSRKSGVSFVNFASGTSFSVRQNSVTREKLRPGLNANGMIRVLSRLETQTDKEPF